jgi:hypothetical protein
MKKILSLLSTISLSTISTNTIACNKPIEDNKTNTPNTLNKPIEQKMITQQPPKNSNWKLIDISWQKSMEQFKTEFLKNNNKWYFFIESDIYGFNKFLAKNNNNNIKEVNVWNWILKLNNGNYSYVDVSKLKSIYCWNGDGEPQTPEINKKTGEIIKWNEK